MQALCRFVGKISNICGKIGEVMSIILMLMIFGSILVGVFSRTFTDWGLLCPEEVARFSMVASMFIGGSVAMKKFELTRFDFFMNRGKKRSGTFYRTIVYILELVFVSCFVYCGFRALPAYTMFRAVGLPITLVVPAGGMVLGGAFMLIHLINQILHQLNCLVLNQPDMPAEKEV